MRALARGRAWSVPEELSARVPAERRGPGLGRDAVRLLVSRGTEVTHHAFPELPGLLRAGDLLLVNTSPTLAAAADGRLGSDRVVVHFSTRGEDGRWAVELRAPDGRGTTRPRAGGPAGAVVELAEGVRLVLEEPLAAGSERLWWARAVASGARDGRVRGGNALGGNALGGNALGGGPHDGGAHDGDATGADATGTDARDGGAADADARDGGAAGRVVRPSEVVDVPGLLRRHGRPIRYAYTERDQPLSAYQTVFALPGADGAGSAEMPSAARPFTPRLVAELVSRGVQFAPLTLHTGVASAEAHEPPYPEGFAVPEASARLVNAARAGGGRVVAVGTTAVRAVESAAGADGIVRACAGWTDLVVTPGRGVRVVDGLLTGLHEPEASHLLMLEAVAGREAVERGYEEALAGRYLWHEFGDVHLLLR
ncbi:MULTISPECIES: S-adenosylmethionine:tRNA ribosyltransferase-isomerase [unclassified Streptomyces]|uniref:S-adenosylmethionine:tRNA ribosyltransferase-isomerase n=1 Tax=unclassified Streptomyces TaxID=2593676 RepID=UPI001F28035C|nr:MULTISPECIES: S-adenosylmethionine:tRNA ribosyltransferase-isomerase [unclassified Streptomyces]MCF0090474.1 S-adenosylmethionine:tRNA ribosyltransferase-isomerase [Streptomyces sp. MH192]MCF0102807.1 S-adenosylmethionine:tRNA ribosyltransferase-isomerase [Streptomyces sp. MH191]